MCLAYAEVARKPVHEAPAQDPAGKFFPLFVFQGLQELRSDARGGSNFLKRVFAQLPFALQALPKRTLGHFVEPLLDFGARFWRNTAVPPGRNSAGRNGLRYCPDAL